jgi:hypothetical protein
MGNGVTTMNQFPSQIKERIKMSKSVKTYRTIPYNTFLLDGIRDYFDEQMAVEANLQRAPECIRADGNVVCDSCKKLYWHHPRLIPWYFLHLACDGRVLKL